MSHTDQKEILTERPGENDAASESHISGDGENPEIQCKLNGGRDDSVDADPEAGDASGKDLPLSDDNDPKPEVKINLTPENFKLVIIDTAEDTTEIVANADYHAFFIKDKIASSCLEEFASAANNLWLGETPRSDSGMSAHDAWRAFPPLVERLRNKSPNTKVIFTIKKQTAIEESVRTRQYINILCDRLNLSNRDKDMIACAGYIHTLAKIGHPHRLQGKFRLSPEVKTKLVECFSENSAIIKILRSMYRSLKPGHIQRPSLELIGANILTIVDLFCDTVHEEEYLDAATLKTISQEFLNLGDRLLLTNIIEAFNPLPGRELKIDETDPQSTRVVVYSDRPYQIYPLKVRLRNEGMQVITTDSLESLAAFCKKGLPDILVMRINSAPNGVVKVMQFLAGNGIDIGAIPTFLMVKNSIIARLATLLKIGIEDIMDIETSLDVLLLKIRKVQTHSEQSARVPQAAAGTQSGSRGNLCEMNLIDLLQALGPSRRTTRITVNPEDSPSPPLTIYLNRGNIIFAELGELKGETAIHKGLGWASGTWVIEQISSDDLPEPNNDLPNEAILMEGCRLLDEKTR